MKPFGIHLPEKFQHWIVDSAILSISITCFSLFIYNSLKGVPALSTGISIAKVAEGSPERKRLGMLSFSSAPEGTELFHRDAIWVGEGKRSVIHFDSGSLLKISEKTLVVLYRQRGAPDQIDVLAGQVKLVTKSGKPDGSVRVNSASAKQASEPEPLETASPEPVASPSPPPSDAEIQYLKPKPNTTFYLASKKNSIEVAFAWPKAIQGTLLITDTKQKEILKLAVTDKAFIRGVLAVGHTYEWQVRGEDSKPVFGPYKFSILPFDKESFNKALFGGTPDNPIEVVN